MFLFRFLFLFLRATSLIGIGLLFQRLCDLLPDVVEGIGAGVVDLSGFPALAAHQVLVGLLLSGALLANLHL